MYVCKCVLVRANFYVFSPPLVSCTGCSLSEKLSDNSKHYWRGIRRIYNSILCVFYVLLTVHLSVSLDNDQLDAHLLCFTTRPLQYYMFRALHAHHQEVNCIDAASTIVLSVSGRTVRRLRENCSASMQLTS